MKRRTRSVPIAAVVATLGLVAAACGSGDSALQSGADRTTTTVASTDADPGDDDSEDPDTGDDGPGDDSGDGDDGESGDGGSGDGPATTAAPTPTTEPAPLADLPDCPVGALDDADGPVEIEFWHAMTNELETSLISLTDAYNAGQDRVRVRLENQIGYEQAFETFTQSSAASRPAMVQLSEVAVQVIADSGTVVPVAACLEAAGTDTSVFLDRVLAAYTTGGVQWSMPFNVSNPVLYYNMSTFEAAGLDPSSPPTTLTELRDASQAIVDAGAAGSGIALDTGVDSGGGWFIEQWFARAGEFYADNDNGRAAPATRVLYDGAAGVELLTFVQALITDGLAVNVGDNPTGQDHFLRMADPVAPAAMTIGTSAALGTVLAVLDGGLIQGITGDQLGVGPMPGPDGDPAVLVGGASLYVVADKDDVTTAATWDFIEYLVSAESQSTWAAETGYVPIRSDAVDLEPLASVYVDDPRFKVPYDQLLASPDDPAAYGPVLGPQREVRTVTARAVAEIFTGGDVQASLTRSAEQANALLADYSSRN